VADESLTYVWERDRSALVWVPAGEFTMGHAPKAFLRTSVGLRHNLSDRPSPTGVRVRLTRGVFMGKYEVTWEQWDRYCAAVSKKPDSRLFDERFEWFARGTVTSIKTEDWFAPDDHPAAGTSWIDAKAYCDWAGLRLPTEAEWARAARGDTAHVYVWGDTFDATACNAAVENEFPFTSPVGAFPRDRSPFGCFDMNGNVSERVADYSGPTPAGPLTDPTGGPATEKHRVARGGNWAYRVPALLATAYRDIQPPESHGRRWGFRVALSPSR
jgi:formylglycine-generating enzyme required for sulfatase activity